MAYAIQLVQVNASAFGLSASGTTFGFPTSTNFHTLLMSFWACGPLAVPGVGAPGSFAGIWPAFGGFFFDFSPGANNIVLVNGTTSATFFQGTLGTLPAPGILLHVMLSVDTHAQVVQVYVNDVAVPVTGSWTGTPPYDFNFPTFTWHWDVAGVVSSARHPALADAWITNPPAFVDLSVAANRRKFINHDLSPVDLGNTGANPFGYQPALYMSVRPGGVPADILTNRGTGGGLWHESSGASTFQAPGSCTLPAPPAPLQLAMDNVVATVTTALLSTNLIWLSWSDDRGHSYGSPVSQSIGEAGEYRTSLQWQRLAYSRDRVFKLEWSSPQRTALQGCWVDVTPAQS